MRVALLFDNALRPETTGIYCRRALGELVQIGRLTEVEHFLPSDLPRLVRERGRWDLLVAVDDGLDYELPTDVAPLAYWAIDTHLDFERSLRRAKHATWTFAAQKNGAERLRQLGIPAEWLPLACDPELHGRRDVSPKYDWSFVGHVFPGERQRLIELLQQHHPNSFVGQQYFQDMAAVYSASKVVFNRSVADDLNMRVFEALCSGALLVTNDLPDNGLVDLFQDGEHFVTYRQDDELLQRVSYYLTHAEERGRIASAGRAEVLARHTYRHRMERLLEVVTSSSTATAHIDSKPTTYFEHARPDVQELVPRSARRILDVGCGAGRLGAALKLRQPAHVTGIELNPAAATAARDQIDAVKIANLELDDLDFGDGQFDCVICADILEHLRRPEIVLKNIRRWLSPEGMLILSVPNVRNHTVVQSLLAGNWTYESAGLLDSDHVRFFTRRELEKLLFRAGFEIDDLRMVPGDGFQAWVDQGRPCELNLNGLSIHAATDSDAAEFFAYQYLVRAVPSRRSPDSGLTSIILVTWNQLPYTQMCLDSLRLRTDEPYELIVVDNGSTDDTVEWLRFQTDVRLIENAENRGFPAAVNQGLQIARGENLLLLNNDTILTTGWLRRVLDVLHSDPKIGLVGPTSNCVGSAQQIPVDYTHLNDLDGFAWDRRSRLLARGIPLTEETDKLIGFCLLFKREVLDAVGLLDERFGIGCFEDDDFCRRAIAAGYLAVIARDAFIHHFGSVTFQSSGADLGQVLRNNQQVYRDKWKDEESHAETQRCGAEGGESAGVERGSGLGSSALASRPLPKPRPSFLLDQDEDGNLILEPNTIRLSGCLIVRNNETTIRPCLESLKPWVDELIVVDTGSTDATPRIAEEIGARVFHWPWQDDFAAARNVSLDHARGEWLFWMDSDDVIPEDCGRKLRALADGKHPDHLFGYVMQVHCPGNDHHDVTVVDHVKLFRNRPELRFEFRIHEQILPAIRRAGGDVAFTDIYVVHAGSDRTRDGQAKKLERDFKLLHLELADQPDHPFVLFNLGMTHADCGQHDEAIRYLERCLQVSGPDESHVRKAYALLISSLMQSGRFDNAESACTQGRIHYPDDKELLFRQAMLEHHFGRLAAAAATYQEILDADEPRHFTSIDAGLAGYKTRHNLALVYEDLGNWDLAEEQWLRVIAEVPDYAAGWQGLAAVQRTKAHWLATGSPT